jgi:uncharacterized protein
MSLLIVRLVVFVLLFWAGWRLWQFWLQQQNNRLDQQDDQNKTSDNPSTDTMVPCAQCGVHLPRASAIESGQHYFCCREHQEAFDKEDKE